MVQFLELGTHGAAELGVEIAQGFVEEEGFGVADDRSADGDALALAAREGLGLAFAVTHLIPVA